MSNRITDAMRTRRAGLAALAALALAGALGGCADGAEEGSTPTTPGSPSPTESPTPTPTDDPDGDEPDGEEPDDVPAGFPDPEALIGQEAYDEQDPDGSWHTVVGGEPLDLTNVFGACFEGDTDDVCAYSISGAQPGEEDGRPAPAEASLLLLLRSTGERDDGTPTWEVLDAIITRPPGDDPAVLQACDGEPGIAFYPAGDAEGSDTFPVAAAWGPDEDISSLVEVDPDDLTCAAPAV